MTGIEHLIRMEPMQIKLIGLSIFIVRQRGAKFLMQGLPPQEGTIQIETGQWWLLTNHSLNYTFGKNNPKLQEKRLLVYFHMVRF